ncbi:LOW QUALITY PROTEIN: SKI family transcriptional corepressor 2 [Marmota marmota marmota]|uniref:LOW QUALITY PROTEIN: SKI family transcriptional corepressor 2 n=1 Tax=Marmota marmota marmota TaxID=9994 RepID=UPI0020932727|nr:LOW QUALITY PROTEIN: SKI family transcriptional corepressor 2 [Marmota marmota marmota]
MASSPLPGPNDILLASPSSAFQPDALSQPRPGHANLKPNQVGQVILYGIPIVSLVIDGQERLCLAQISNTLLKNFSYNEIHNRRVALGITCVQCTPVQLEILRRAGAMPISSRRCGMITKREAERLCKSFLGENRPPKLPDNFAFDVSHECAWGCRGSFIPARYNSSRAKCIKCSYCNMYFSPNKFIFHSHRTPDAKYTQPDAANFNSWRRHLKLTDKSPQDELVFAWEDVKAMFNGGSRKRALPQPGAHPACHPLSSVKAAAVAAAAAVAGGGGLLGPPPAGPQRNVRSLGAVSAGAGPAGARVPAPHHPHLLEGRKAGGGSYHHSSAFRPVGGKDDAESLAKLHGASAGAPHSAQAHHHHHHHHPHHHHHHHPAQPPSPLLLLPPQSDEPGSERHHPAPPPPPPPPPPMAPQSHHRGLLSPGGTSCSYPSEDSSEDEDDEEEEQEVDVEGHKPLEGEEEEEESRDPEDDEEEDEENGVSLGDPLVGGGRFLQGRGLSDKGNSRDRAAAAAGAFPLTLNSSRLLQEDGKLGDPGSSDLPPPPPPPLAPQKASGGSSSPGSPVHHPSLEEQPSYKDNQKTKENNQAIISTKDDNNFSDKNKEHSFFITDSDASGGDFWRERSGEHTQETSSPHSLKKDVENMGKEELQKVLFEQIDLRRRLEQEFQVLKGNTSFPVFNNFQDQMKRELAYREEMVQQLQIIPYAASLIRKEKLGAHLSKS